MQEGSMREISLNCESWCTFWHLNMSTFKSRIKLVNQKARNEDEQRRRTEFGEEEEEREERGD